MDRSIRFIRTDSPRIAVKPTISEDLSGGKNHNVTKLQYLQKKNEKFNGLHTRHNISLPSRGQQRTHSLSRNLEHVTTGYSSSPILSNHIDADLQETGTVVWNLAGDNAPVSRKRRKMTETELVRNRALKAMGGACDTCRRRKKKCYHKPSPNSLATQSQELLDHQTLALRDYHFQLKILEQNRRMRERGQNQSTDMTPELLKEMDRLSFRTLIPIDTGPNMIPEKITTWSQLKAWIVQNLGSLGNIDVAKLLELQRLSLTELQHRMRP